MTQNSNFIKTSRQREATLLHSQFMHVMLYGGSRSGKTAIDIRNIVIRALKTPSRHLIARFRFKHCKEAIGMDTFPKVMSLAFPEVVYELNKSDWYAKFENGSEIWFGGLDDAERVDNILGKEYSTIKLNECTQISWDSRNTVMSRLAENSGLNLMAMYDCNPTSKKHWTYTLFKKGETPDGEKIKNFDQYACLQMNPTDNLANLPPAYISLLESMPERQRIRFLNGEFQDDIEGALWNFEMLVKARQKNIRDLRCKVLSIDPAVTNRENSDLTGLVVCGIDEVGNGIVLGDYSLKASPNDWANRAVNIFHKYECNYIVVEVNQGGDLVKTLIHSIDSTIPIKEVRASVGKFARAEPIAMFYEQEKIAHVEGLEELESEMMEYVPLNSKKSPDRLDAMVWGFTDLMLRKKVLPSIRSL